MLIGQLNKVGIAALAVTSIFALSACTSTEMASLENNSANAAKTAEASEIDISGNAETTELADTSASDAVVSLAEAEETEASIKPLALAATTTKITDAELAFPPAPGEQFAAVTIKTRSETAPPEIEALIKKYSRIYGVPEDLVHHVAHRESTYNPAAISRGNYGLMQIRYRTAKGMGYKGKPEGLLDAETNLKYAVKYLHNAWFVANKDEKAADWLYRTGYYYQAKNQGKLKQLQLLNKEGLH